MINLINFHLKHFRRQRHDLGKTALAQLARHRPENTRAARILGFGINQHDRIIFKSNVSAVLAPRFFYRAHQNAVRHFALFYHAVRSGLFDGNGHNIADARVSFFISAANMNALDAFGSGIVG